MYGLSLRDARTWQLLVAKSCSALPEIIFALPLTVLVHAATKSYTWVAVAEVLYIAASLIASPIWARIIDQSSSLPLVWALAFVHALSMSAFALAPWHWALLALMATAGASVTPLSSFVRRGWASVIDAPSERILTQAHGVENALTEMLFVIGPLSAAALVASGAARAGMIICGLLPLLAAAAWQRAAELCRDQELKLTSSPVPVRLLLPILGYCTSWVFMWRSMDMIAIAMHNDRGWAAAGGLVIAAVTVGAAAGALLYSHSRLAGTALRTEMLVGAAFTAACLPLAVLSATWSFAGALPALILCGMGSAPAFSGIYTWVDQSIADDLRVRSYVWVGISFGIGASVGAASSGALYEHGGWQAVLAAGAVAAVLCCTFATRARTKATRTHLEIAVAQRP